MVVDTSNFPPLLPAGEYRGDVTVYTYIDNKEEFVLLFQDYIEVKQVGIEYFWNKLESYCFYHIRSVLRKIKSFHRVLQNII